MFLGNFVHNLDSKGRLTIPAKYRTYLADGLVVTRGMDECLVAFPMARWEQLSAKVSDLPITDPRARSFKRFLFASASDLSPDKQGRILIPPRLREYAGLDGEVVVAGLNDYFEIWNREAWHGQRGQGDKHALELESWAALGI